ALRYVQFDLAQRFACVRWIHLITASVAKLGRGARSFAKWAVETGSILRGVRHDRNVGEVFPIQRLTNGRNAPVHHVGGSDHICAGSYVTDGSVGQELQGRVILHIVVFDDAAMPVGRVFAQADVRDEKQVANVLANGPQRLLYDAVLVVSIG